MHMQFELACEEGGSVAVSLDQNGRIEMSISVGGDTGRGRYVSLGLGEATALAHALRAAAGS